MNDRVMLTASQVAIFAIWSQPCGAFLKTPRVPSLVGARLSKQRRPFTGFIFGLCFIFCFTNKLLELLVGYLMRQDFETCLLYTSDAADE